jgi:DNA damage-inducible protein 1
MENINCYNCTFLNEKITINESGIGKCIICNATIAVKCSHCTVINNYQNQKCKVCENDIPKNQNINMQVSEKESRIIKNLETAFTQIPESFIKVEMLYIPCQINGVDMKAFIDTGAQMSIMSQNVAAICGIDEIIDEKYKGVAIGVGKSKIIGKIHLVDIIVRGNILPCSFTILENNDLDLLLGLDMLLSHGCVLDLKRRKLIINGNEVDFIKKNE